MRKLICPMCDTSEVLTHADRLECFTCGHEWIPDSAPEPVVKPAPPRRAHPPVSMNEWIPTSLLHAFAAEQTSAHRLFTSAEAWVERLGQDVLISHKNQAALDTAFSGLRSWESATGFTAQRVFSRFLPRQNAERVASILMNGDPALPLETVVTENGLRFGIDFQASYAAGLFLDQRANRHHLRQNNPKRVLNTFAYTCSFSVVAAHVGAKTLSIDLSQKSLDRGKANFNLNHLSLEGHRFVADDVMEVLPRLERQGETFDLLILDPPTFSIGHQGRRWRVEDQMGELLRAALELASPRASVLVSTNCTKLDQPSLERIARFALKITRRNADFYHQPNLPDFPTSQGAETLWLKLK
jgi:23S rRNA (cytosine1962-C5)-methyltransferase